MKTITIDFLGLAGFVLFVLLCWLLASCAAGPDYSPDVVTHAASYGGGSTPTFDATGRVTGMRATGADRVSRKTMLHD